MGLVSPGDETGEVSSPRPILATFLDPCSSYAHAQRKVLVRGTGLSLEGCICIQLLIPSLVLSEDGISCPRLGTKGTSKHVGDVQP